jgi:hypothetical protein
MKRSALDVSYFERAQGRWCPFGRMASTLVKPAPTILPKRHTRLFLKASSARLRFEKIYRVFLVGM